MKNFDLKVDFLKKSRPLIKKLTQKLAFII